MRNRHNSAGWYPWGLPQKSDSTWLFASRLIEKLHGPEDGGGRAVTFMAPGSLQRHGADNDIRRAILEQDLVEAIVGLPGRLSPLTDILLYAIVFANKKPENRKGKIRIINLRPYFETSRDQQTAPRALTREAFDVLTDGLRSVNPRVACRTVPVEYSIRRRVHVRREGDARAPQLSPDAQSPEWDVYLPGTENAESSLIRRYGPIRVASNTTDKLFCPLEIDSQFDETLRRVSSGPSSSNGLPLDSRLLSPAHPAYSAKLRGFLTNHWFSSQHPFAVMHPPETHRRSPREAEFSNSPVRRRHFYEFPCRMAQQRSRA